MKYLSLVFDDGPSYNICRIADKINAYGWSAGFAVIGRKITDETVPMLKYVTERGCSLVSHGQEHLHTERLSSREEIAEELLQPVRTVEEKLNYKITMARLPFLSQSSEVLRVAKDLMLPLLGQGIDSGDDWDIRSTPDKISNAVLGSVCDGAVGCLHTLENTCTALDIILPELKSRGFRLVAPDELFRKKGITPPLGIQINNINDFLTGDNDDKSLER